MIQEIPYGEYIDMNDSNEIKIDIQELPLSVEVVPHKAILESIQGQINYEIQTIQHATLQNHDTNYELNYTNICRQHNVKVMLIICFLIAFLLVATRHFPN
jgi:hypothetical protein